MNRIQCKASELSILLHYCLVVGYCIRMLEVIYLALPYFVRLGMTSCVNAATLIAGRV